MSLTNNDTLLQVNNLKKYFPTPHGLLYAVDNVSFNINKGDTLGVVGESGCGKSTLGRSILRLHEPTAGEVIFEGKNILSLNHAQMKHMRKDMQLIFQDPYESLNPRMTVSQAIQAPMLIQGMYKSKDKAALEKRTLEMMDMVGLARRLVNSYPHELGSELALRVRLRLNRSSLYVMNLYRRWMYQFRRRY